MARTPKRLHGPATVSNVAATKYTVPAVTKTVVRQIHVSNPSGAAIDFTLSIGADAAGTRLYDGLSIPADSIRTDFVYEIIEAAEIIQAFSGGAGGILVLTIDGDEITLG